MAAALIVVAVVQLVGAVQVAVFVVVAVAAVVVVIDVVGPGGLGRIGTGRNLACRLRWTEAAASFGYLRYYRRPIMLRAPWAAVAIVWGTSVAGAGPCLDSSSAPITAGEGVLLQARVKSRLLVRGRWQWPHFIRWTSPSDHNSRRQWNGCAPIDPRFGVRYRQLSVRHIGWRSMDLNFGLLLLLLLLLLMVSYEAGG